MPASPAQQMKTAERRRKAIALHLAGADWDTIKEKLGYASRGAAHTDVTRAMEKAAAETIRDADVLRHTELERVTRLQLAYWPKAIAGDTDAAAVVKWCIDRRCKLLGLDAPTRHEVITITALDAEIAKLEAKLGDNDPTPSDPADLLPPD